MLRSLVARPSSPQGSSVAQSPEQVPPEQRHVHDTVRLVVVATSGVVSVPCM
jgi:hypothetical protein